MSILLPRLAMESVTFFLTPIPIAIMMITAATPIMMPSIVKTERSLLEQSAVKAMEILSLNNIHDHPFSGVFRNYTVTQQQLSARAGGDFRFVRDENDRFLFLM